MDYFSEFDGSGKGRDSLGTLALTAAPLIAGGTAYFYLGSDHPTLGAALVFTGTILTCLMGNNISKIHYYKNVIGSYF